MNNKKGDMSLSFIYIFGIIVVALIIFLGIKAVKDIGATAKDSALKEFEIGFTDDLRQSATKRGSVMELGYKVPLEYERLCIFDLQKSANLDSVILDFYPLIKDSLGDMSENVFLIKGEEISGFRSDLIRLDSYPYYHCSQIRSGQIKLLVKGTIIDGQPMSLLLTDDVAKISLKQHIDNDIILFSTDGLLFMKIEEETEITSPTENYPLEISITIDSSGQGSETYAIEPHDTMFSKDIEVGLKVKECNSPSIYLFEFGDTNLTADSCRDDYVIFKTDKI